MSIMKAVTKLANRQSNYRVSDYIRKLRKQYGLCVTKRHVMFAIARLARHGKLHYAVQGKKVITCSCYL